LAAIIEAVASAELTPAEANEISRLLETFTRALEVTEIEERLRRLEQTIKQ
jgi:hypothetical protein